MKTTFTIPAGTNFLSDYIPELPTNCLLNKGMIGCGGTTLILTNNVPSVVCVPTQELAFNKAIQSKENPDLYPHEVFAVYSRKVVSDEEFLEYLKRATVPKIMVTYDSLKRVVDLIKPLEFNLLVDEYHSLFVNYSFRNNAATTVLSNFKLFKNYTFMTATPIEEKYMLDELKDLDIVIYEWEDKLPLQCKVVKNKNGVDKTVVNLIQRALENKIDGNLYFFVNSVTFIKKMIGACRLNNKNCRVVYSDSHKLQLSIHRGKTTDAPKKINFLTSKAFEGCDIYDEVGRTYIISDGNNSYTLTDISTQFLQIAGRIRNSKYKGTITHIVSKTRYSEKISFDEFNKMTEDDINEEKRIVANYLSMPDFDCTLDAAKRKNLQFFYVDEDAKTITMDTNAVKINLYNYKISRDYSSMLNLSKRYQENAVDAKYFEDKKNPVVLRMDDVTSFKETIIELKDLHDKQSSLIGKYKYSSFLQAALIKFSYIENAINLIGFEGIEKLNYHTKNIQRKLISLEPKVSETADLAKISKMFQNNQSFSTGSLVTVNEIKKFLKDCYDELDIKKNATAKDIETYYYVNPKSKSVNNRQQRAYVIMAPKIFVTT